MRRGREHPVTALPMLYSSVCLCVCLCVTQAAWARKSLLYVCGISIKHTFFAPVMLYPPPGDAVLTLAVTSSGVPGFCLHRRHVPR